MPGASRINASLAISGKMPDWTGTADGRAGFDGLSSHPLRPS
jgi:hypothetical protein